ncbi:MAG: hypothetical protein H0U00_11035 [Actinobacteria bacterium]|nr:hypothetical protein [Actinomycetota bacterium]
MFRSRVAAAYFNSIAPAGWRAASAGRLPEGDLSDNARRVVANGAAAAYLEEGTARPVEAFVGPEQIIAIDCDVPGAVRWTLSHEDPTGIAEELRCRVHELVEDGRGLPSGSL